MNSGLEIVDRSISSRIADAFLFFAPACLMMYLIVFRFKHESGRAWSMLFHWCLIAVAFTLVSMMLYNLLHSVRYFVTVGGVERTDRKAAFFKSIETIPRDAIDDIAIETGKNSFTGTARYLLVLRLKNKRTDTIITSSSQAQIQKLQQIMKDLLKPGT